MKRKNPKMTLLALKVLVRSRHDQDLAEARDWWRGLTFNDKARLWLYLNRRYADSYKEVMSRLAILAYEDLALAND